MINSNEILAKVYPFSAERIEDIGDVLQYALPWAALLAAALTGDQQGAWAWLYSGLAVTGLTFLLKFIFNFTAWGKRPGGAGYAFPSGHTSSAFMGACFIHFSFGLNYAVLPYLLAAFTGYSRIYAKKHWLRDVIAGALLAAAVTYYIVMSLNSGMF